MYEEVKAMKKACGPKVHMKSILAVGELGTMANVYKASLVCMMAGSDFIKTSTGKESVNATLPVGLVMCRYSLIAIFIDILDLGQKYIFYLFLKTCKDQKV